MESSAVRLVVMAGMTPFQFMGIGFLGGPVSRPAAVGLETDPPWELISRIAIGVEQGQVDRWLPSTEDFRDQSTRDRGHRESEHRVAAGGRQVAITSEATEVRQAVGRDRAQSLPG